MLMNKPKCNTCVKKKTLFSFAENSHKFSFKRWTPPSLYIIYSLMICKYNWWLRNAYIIANSSCVNPFLLSYWFFEYIAPKWYCNHCMYLIHYLHLLLLYNLQNYYIFYSYYHLESFKQMKHSILSTTVTFSIN